MQVFHPLYSLSPLSPHLTDIYLSINPKNHFAPIQHYTIINESTTLYCDAVGSNAYWGINSFIIDDEGRSPWTDMEFVFIKKVTYDPLGNEHVHHNSLQVPSQKEYNNTEITCVVLDERHLPVTSNAIEIIVMGKLFS